MHKLASENMSGDESDNPEPAVPKIWRIIFAAWQSAELRNFLWALDAKYIKDRARPQEEGKRRTPGNSVRARMPLATSSTVPGVAPPGLWRNCYDEDWLAGQSDWEREQLDIIDGVYDFTLDPPVEA